MKNLYISLIVCFVCVASNFSASAQKTVFHENNIWYLDKQTAIDSAYSQNKQIFVCYGRDICGYTTNVRHLLGYDERLKPLVDSAYILWYVNADLVYYTWTDTGEYFYDPEKKMANATLP
ncbi:MAG: hypothetical protein LBN11_08205, partial [Tannerella sp.]|nr:hypothetical protein [Tannerella sp.]